MTARELINVLLALPQDDLDCDVVITPTIIRDGEEYYLEDECHLVRSVSGRSMAGEIEIHTERIR
jgi:hypothetical protein